MTPQELKNSILQLAIQGKLVEQRPEEGTAEELYRQIQAEKQRLIKEGKLKKERPLPEITEDEIPFDIPESWKWVRLGDCTSYAEQKVKISADNIAADMWSLDLEDIEKDTGRIVNYTRASERTIIGDKVQFSKGQILFSKLRPYLKKILVAPDDGICSSEMVPFTPYGNIDAYYLVYVLKAPHVDYVINSVTYGVKMPRVGTETMVNLLIPLPPLAEQKRIVAKIEELMPYIERYEKAWSKLKELNKRFPIDLQKSILQMAIQGKLVEQRLEEGTAEELYQQIQAEKQRLIKAGKIKNEKPLHEISEDEIPFNIPESWFWIRLGKALIIERGGSPRPIKDYLTDSEDGINWIKIGDADKGGKYINSTQEKIIPEGKKKSRFVHKGVMLFCFSITYSQNEICHRHG
jgi:type I restriction enzyme S subunit